MCYGVPYLKYQRRSYFIIDAIAWTSRVGGLRVDTAQ